MFERRLYLHVDWLLLGAVYLLCANGNLLVQTGGISTPPQIIGQPQNQIVEPGEFATFSVVAANTRSLSYQWRFNGSNISGTTNDAVLLQNVSTNNEGEYHVVLTNPSGSVTSAPALLMIDSDADGVPDSWELAYFGNLTNSATADFDGDRSSNLQEFVYGTSPTNRTSVRFHLTVINDGGSVTIQPTSSGYTNGQSVMLTANAFSNELFHAWLGDIVTVGHPRIVGLCARCPCPLGSPARDQRLYVLNVLFREYTVDLRQVLVAALAL